MSFTAELETYNVYYFGKKDSSNKAIIYARDAQGHVRVFMLFMENGTELHDSIEDVVDGVPRCRLWYHIDQFPAVIDILRNEQPVYVHYSNPTFAHIFTGSEPIGEGELDELI